LKISDLDSREIEYKLITGFWHGFASFFPEALPVLILRSGDETISQPQAMSSAIICGAQDVPQITTTMPGSATARSF